MLAKWKRRGALNPAPLLDQIETSIQKDEQGRVSFHGFESSEAMRALESMIDLSDKVYRGDLGLCLLRAISAVAKNDVLTPDRVMQELIRILSARLATKETRYHLLSTVSVSPDFPFKRIFQAKSSIRILGGDYPNKYHSRYVLLREREFQNPTPAQYMKLVVSVWAKTEKYAVSSALDVLDRNRAIWNLLITPALRFGFGVDNQPINRIRLGEAHTLHRESGKQSENSVWYEPAFRLSRPFSPKDKNNLRKSANWFGASMMRLPYGRLVSDSLIRYVRAFDEPDPNVAFLRMWPAVEMLCAPDSANFDPVVRRISFLFKRTSYYKQILEHLRESRNTSVHSGDQSEHAQLNCYQLFSLYRELVLFHVRRAGEFDSLEAANQFLDLSSNVAQLESQRSTLDRAIEFRS